ncbi:MAG TPA: phage holin, LLH family [Anaerolineae bacterium]|nr:phage holin, LLH family [Anaerolineae bacterium]
MTQEALVAFGLTVGVALVLAVLWTLMRYLRELAADIQDERKRGLAEMLVQAAEKAIGAGKGEDKFDWVIRWAKKLNLPLTEAHIEAAVLMLRQSGWEEVIEEGD